MSTHIETILKTTRALLAEQGYISESGFDENAPLELDSFARLSLVIQLEEMLSVEIKADLFFEQAMGEEDETLMSLCQRLQKSIPSQESPGIVEADVCCNLSGS